MKLGPKRRVTRAIQRVQNELRARTGPSHYARGLSVEGYVGGYFQALCDIELVLNGVMPSRPPGLELNPWRDE